MDFEFPGNFSRTSDLEPDELRTRFLLPLARYTEILNLQNSKKSAPARASPKTPCPLTGTKGEPETDDECDVGIVADTLIKLASLVPEYYDYASNSVQCLSGKSWNGFRKFCLSAKFEMEDFPFEAHAPSKTLLLHSSTNVEIQLHMIIPTIAESLANHIDEEAVLLAACNCLVDICQCHLPAKIICLSCNLPETLTKALRLRLHPSATPRDLDTAKLIISTLNNVISAPQYLLEWDLSRPPDGSLDAKRQGNLTKFYAYARKKLLFPPPDTLKEAVVASKLAGTWIALLDPKETINGPATKKRKRHTVSNGVQLPYLTDAEIESAVEGPKPLPPLLLFISIVLRYFRDNMKIVCDSLMLLDSITEATQYRIPNLVHHPAFAQVLLYQFSNLYETAPRNWSSFTFANIRTCIRLINREDPAYRSFMLDFERPANRPNTMSDGEVSLYRSMAVDPVTRKFDGLRIFATRDRREDTRRRHITLARNLIKSSMLCRCLDYKTCRSTLSSDSFNNSSSGASVNGATKSFLRCSKCDIPLWCSKECMKKTSARHTKQCELVNGKAVHRLEHSRDVWRTSTRIVLDVLKD
ncbi:hypothetical protein HK102_002183 [Quaeritorhiza haematococci]|nr:hypothetical protein HK102_002183 [Quaeritorhiza haematococci]